MSGNGGDGRVMAMAEAITAITSEVFATMVLLDLDPGEPQTGPGGNLVSNVTSMIGLAGDLRGVLAVHCPEKTARAITGSMLGLEVEELSEDVKDAIGEIANMVAGGLKISLSAEQVNVELATPSTAIGTCIRLAGMRGAKRLLVPFITPSGEFTVELKYLFS